MTKIQIRKVNGVPMGRPVNPFSYKVDGTENHEWLANRRANFQAFEQSVTEHEAPGCDEGEAEGELQWMLYPDYKERSMRGEIDGYNVWIVPPPEKAEVKEAAVGNLLHEAASKHASKHASNSGRDFNSIEYNIIFHAFIAGANWQQQKQAETISRLRGGMEWIAKFCNDPACKRLAKEALK